MSDLCAQSLDLPLPHAGHTKVVVILRCTALPGITVLVVLSKQGRLVESLNHETSLSLFLHKQIVLCLTNSEILYVFSGTDSHEIEA